MLGELKLYTEAIIYGCIKYYGQLIDVKQNYFDIYNDGMREEPLTVICDESEIEENVAHFLRHQKYKLNKNLDRSRKYSACFIPRRFYAQTVLVDVDYKFTKLRDMTALKLIQCATLDNIFDEYNLRKEMEE